MADQNYEIVGEVLQKIFGAMSEYASEKIGVADIANASEEEVESANRQLLENSDEIADEVASRQAANEAVCDIIDKILEKFPEELAVLEGEGLQWRGLQQAITGSDASLVSAWTDSLADE